MTALLLLGAAALHALSLSGTTGPWTAPLQCLALAVLFHCVQTSSSAKQAALRTFGFVTVWLFLDVQWIHHSLSTYGGMPAASAWLSVLVLCAALGLYHAAASALWHRCFATQTRLWQRALAQATAWSLAEMARSAWFTGFPWATPGYAHVDASLSLLSPYLGVMGLTWVSAMVSAWLAQGIGSRPNTLSKVSMTVGILVMISLPVHPTSKAQDELKQSILLLQTNVNPNDKFVKPEDEANWYLGHMARSTAQLTIAPETALASIGSIERMRPWYDQWRQEKSPDQGLIVGAMQAMGDDYANAAWGFMDGQLQMHLKAHLVPFGEFSPPGFAWFAKQLNIPYSNFKRPERDNRAFLHQQQVYGLSICYEDLFGDEMARAFVDPQRAPPTTLINLSNLAWFGDGMALDQHLVIGRMRAKEFQRPMIMSTNTGWSAVIDDAGRVQAKLPKGERAILALDYRGVNSTPTPYAQWAGRWGHLPLWIVQLLLLLGLALASRRWSRPPENPNIAT